jgi:Uma2 family endonuclease
MSGGTMVTLEEYLNTAYSPDREYVDGVVVERNVGERPHSFVQSRITVILSRNYPALFVWTEWRSRTRERRCRVPDVCVTLQDPGTDILEEPPFLVIEIPSRRDEMSDVLDKLKEYAAIGVPNIWLFDPRRQRAFTFAGNRLEEVTGPTIATSDAAVQLRLDDVFRGL